MDSTGQTTTRPRVKNGHCAKCGSSHLCSWTNDRVVICEECGANHAWSATFYRGGYAEPAACIHCDSLRHGSYDCPARDWYQGGEVSR